MEGTYGRLTLVSFNVIDFVVTTIVMFLQELAGLGGDTAHIKHSTAFQVAHKLLSSTSVSLSGRLGCLYPFASLSPSSFSSSASIPKSRFSDRFQLGGPLDVRMFKQNGLGLRDGNDALGGELFWCLGLSVIRDLPGLSKEAREGWKGNVKMHGFVNAGRLDLIDRGEHSVFSFLSHSRIYSYFSVLLRSSVISVPPTARLQTLHLSRRRAAVSARSRRSRRV